MVSGTRLDGGSQIIPARIRKTIQSIKEIVGNHSDADIYVMLKETNMDPNETAQKLLNQDPFHEVRRKRDKKKEDIGNNGYAEPVKHIEHVGRGIKSRTYVDRNARRGGYGRNALPGISREFRIVRDNRVNQDINREAKPAPLQCSTSANEKPVSNVSERNSKVISTDQKHSGIRNSEGQKAYNNPINGPYDSGSRHSRDASIDGVHSNDVLVEAQTTVSYSVSRPRELKPNNSQHNSATLASSSSVVGVYSSSLDPVHVPSPDSRSSGPVGAIKREVGVVGVRRQQSSENSEHSSLPSNSFPNPLLRREISPSAESFPPSTSITKSDQLSQTTEPDSIMSSMSVSRSFLNTHYSSKPHQQLVGHQKAIQANMEWKPKSSQKSSSINPGGIGTATAPMSPVGNDSSDLKTEAADMPVKLSRVTIFENQHVIIPQHLRVPEADRARLIFGNFGAELDSSKSSATGFQELESADESNGEPSASVSASTSAISSEDVSGGNQELLDDQIRNSRSDSPSAVASELPLPDKRESLSPQNLENYADIGLVRNVSAAYTPVEQHQRQDPPGLPSFQAYDPQSGYDAPFFRPTVDENMRGQGLPSPQEALSSHTPNSIPASTMPIVQQPVAQLYPHVHLSHFPSFMPYRQFLSPVYVPPMAVPGYSSNAAYQHPSNSSSYLVMPGGSSHLTASGLKYGTQQYKPIPAANPTGFGNYTSQAGYALNSPGVVGGATGLEDSTRIKYKEGNLYIPNPQAETSEIWIQTPRELPGMQSAPYYNIPGQAPHAAYLPSHTAHASFNAAAAAQSPHMQFPGMYHPSPQPASIANPHHMVPGGVAAAAPGAQVGPYQQPQIGHLNWTTNF